MWEKFGIYYAYTGHTGSWTNPPKEVHFQTTAQIKFHYVPDLSKPETANRFSLSLVIDAVEDVPAGTHKSIGPINFEMGAVEEWDSGLGQRVLFRSQMVDISSPGRWFRSSSNLKDQIQIVLIVNPADPENLDILVYRMGNAKPIETRQIKLTSLPLELQMADPASAVKPGDYGKFPTLPHMLK